MAQMNYSLGGLDWVDVLGGWVVGRDFEFRDQLKLELINNNS